MTQLIKKKTESRYREENKSVRVILADNNRRMRLALRDLLIKEPGIDVVGEAKTAEEAVHLTRQLAPDVAIVDIHMPDLNGIQTTRKILNNNQGVKVLILSMYSNKRYATLVLNAGASAYVLKDRAHEDLAMALQAIVLDKTFVSAEVIAG